MPATPPIKIETEGAVAYMVLPEAGWPPELADAVKNLTSGQKAPLQDAWRFGDLGVARITRHDGQITFRVAVLPTVIADPGPTPVKTGTVTMNFQAMKDLQKQVDQGHQPWRLDPLQVAVDEGRQYGLDAAAGDQFAMLAPVKQGNPTGRARLASGRSAPSASSNNQEPRRDLPRRGCLSASTSAR